jgi:hypothetical protein
MAPTRSAAGALTRLPRDAGEAPRLLIAILVTLEIRAALRLQLNFADITKRKS